MDIFNMSKFMTNIGTVDWRNT